MRPPGTRERQRRLLHGAAVVLGFVPSLLVLLPLALVGSVIGVAALVASAPERFTWSWLLLPLIGINGLLALLLCAMLVLLPNTEFLPQGPPRVSPWLLATGTCEAVFLAVRGSPPPGLGQVLWGWLCLVPLVFGWLRWVHLKKLSAHGNPGCGMGAGPLV